MVLFTRHDYVDCPKTLTYAASGQDYIQVPSGNFNALSFDLKGTTTATTGADAGRGSLDIIERCKIVSAKYGVLADVPGEQIYYAALQYGYTPPVVHCGAGGGVSSWNATLPICSTVDDVVTVYITWAALATWHSTATAYTGVLTILPDYMDEAPDYLLYYRYRDIGVIGANGSFTDTPDLVENAYMFMELIETYDTALDVTPDDLIDEIVIQHNKTYYVDCIRTLIDNVYARENHALDTAGIVIIKHEPFKNTLASVVTLRNGATATVAGTQMLYGFVYPLAESVRETAMRISGGGIPVGSWLGMVSGALKVSKSRTTAEVGVELGVQKGGDIQPDRPPFSR